MSLTPMAPMEMVCSCFDGSADAIEAEIKSGRTLPAIQENLSAARHAVRA